MKKVIVVGGGASGIISAIFAQISGNDVTIIERNDTLGKKLLVTGNGKCNYFNQDMNLKHYHGTYTNGLDNIINQENINNILNFFDDIGIEPKIKNGYFYPSSNQAISIQNALIRKCNELNINIQLNTCVEYINYLDNEFVLNTDKGIFKCDKVIVSTGSKAMPKTGSDGMGYNFLKKFGHDIIKPLPALVQLIGKGNYFKEWDGIRTDCYVSLYSDNVKFNEEYGEIQLTDYGVSGICIFQLSGLASRFLDDGKNVYITINFLPFIKTNIQDYLESRNKKLSNPSISDLLDTILNYKLVNTILKLCNIDRLTKWNELDDKLKKQLCENLINFKLDIIGTNGFDICQVCSGGVSLEEINTCTMESKIQKSLYVTGEIIDIFGDCGGYNLAFAWISGMIAGINVGNNND